jgi:hypothetical protein
MYDTCGGKMKGESGYHASLRVVHSNAQKEIAGFFLSPEPEVT